MIDLTFIKRLIETVESSDIDTLEYSRWGTKIRISKSPSMVLGANAPGPPPLTFAPANPAAGPALVTAPPAEAAGASSAAAVPAPAEAGPGPALHEVTSPMVGTFYRAPAPDADPYVEVGDRVKTGQTLCILEAMKLMNELEVEVSGTVVEIAVENAEPVEYGQALFRIKPD
ncbi:MAG: acetyl-CoA carboxylase biotin carboxyl carrier protein [Gemmatimonadota bacterium]|nr:MAG: acetyl-CoA carboxylase biotin carboxyl carrier protein [Gemmatimonadota bacterium]